MELKFSIEEIDAINALVQASYCCTISGKELTYGENLEKVLFDKKARDQIAYEEIIDYIDQLELEIQFYYSLGIDDNSLIEKILSVLRGIAEKKM